MSKPARDTIVDAAVLVFGYVLAVLTGASWETLPCFILGASLGILLVLLWDRKKGPKS